MSAPSPSTTVGRDDRRRQDGPEEARISRLQWDRRDWLTITLLALAPWILFWPLFAPGDARQWLPAGDFVDQFYAFARYETARLAAGELPLWNPYAYGGSPFWADVQAAVAYPLSLIVVLFSAWRWGELPFLALELESVAHLSLAAVLTYLFARHALGCRVGGLVAAASFGAGGYLLGYPMLQLAVLETDVWLPLALLGGSLLASRSRSSSGSGSARTAIRPEPALALALAMGILAGHPQSALYLIYLSLAWLLWRAWRSAGDRDAATLRERLGWSRALVLGLLGSLVLAAGLSAAGWWPALEFLGLSNRADAHFAMLSGGFPPQELLGLILPGLTLWSPLYLGLLPLGLALAALAAWGRVGDRPATEITDVTMDEGRKQGTVSTPTASGLMADIPFWLGLLLLTLVLSMGRNAFVFDLFYHLAPGFDLFRGQERAAFLVSFALAMLAGSGAALWWRGARSIDRDLSIFAAGSSVAGFLLALVASPSMRGSALHLAVAGGNIALLVLLARWAGIGVASLVDPGDERPSLDSDARAPEDTDSPTHRLPPRALAWLALLLAMLILDPWTAIGRVNLTGERPEELETSPLLAALDQERPQRVDNEDRLPRNFGLLRQVEATSGASPLRLRRFEMLRDALGDRPRHWRDLMSVSHVLSWRDALEVETTVPIQAGEAEESTYLHRLGFTAPFAWRALQAEGVANDAEAIQRLRDEDFATLSSVILHPYDLHDPHAMRADSAGPFDPVGFLDSVPPIDLSGGSGGSLSVRARQPGYARVNTGGPSPAWVVFSELHYPGWRAYVDDRPAPLVRANLALMAVPVLPGDHVVEIRFLAPRVHQGLAASILSVLVLATVMVSPRSAPRRRRRP